MEVSINKSHSIYELYKRVKDHDLVLTVDAPLADAINARLAKPHLNPFATTPRRLALHSSNDPIKDKRELFVKITKQTNLNWKRASHILENTVNCWKETGNPKNILKHDRFNDEATRTVLDILKASVNPYSAVERYTIPDSKEVAVIAPHQFTSLDKKILPDQYTEITPFKEEQTALPKFNIFNSTTEIIDTVLRNVRELDPKDVAVVMKRDSDYRYLIESSLESSGIPYMVSEDITENEDLRRFISLIRSSFFKRGTKAKDVQPFIEQNIEPSVEDHLLDSFSEGPLKEIKDLLNSIPELTFKELLKNDIFKDKLEQLEEHLETIDLLNKRITLERLNSITYYLETFDITVRSPEQGVLLATPGTSSYIDRPVVFYLGMDSSWTPEPPSTPWIDKKEFDRRKIEDFKILLQNGEKQYFLVQDRKMNQTVTPSFYFNEFTDESIESFRDLKHELNRTEDQEEKEPFTKEDIETRSNPIEHMSQSALNTFAYCPKDHLFSKLTEQPEKVYFKRGILFHHLAEFYMNHPESTEDKEKILEKVQSELSPFLDEHELPSVKTKFDIGIQNLKKFLDSHEPSLKDPKGYEKRWTDNIFSDLFNQPIDTKYTEISFSNDRIGAKGKIDLLLNEEHLLDHKTGGKKTVSKIVRDSDTENIEDRPDFQAKMYIAHHRDHHPDRKIRFTFYHPFDNLKDVLSGEGNTYDNAVNVEYHPVEFNDLTQTEDMFDFLRSSKNRKKVLNKLGYEDYRDFFEDNSVPDLNKDELLEHEVTSKFIAYCQERIGSYKYVKRACRSIMKKFVKFRDTRYFKSDIDRFEEFLQEQIERYNEYRKSDFPVGDVDPDNIDNKDMVII